MPGHWRSKRTPFFERLWPSVTKVSLPHDRELQQQIALDK
jgi:hypothetical protein